MATFSDLELFQKISSNDSRALEILYDRYSSILFSLIKKIVGKDSTAEEILTEVFSIIWKKIDYFNFSGGNVYTWLILLTRNKAVDYLRRSLDASPAEEPYDDEYENNFIIPHLTEGAEQLSLEKALGRRSDIESALGKLTDAQKYVIHLAFYEGFSQKAIAGKLNIPVQTIKSKLQIALNNLKDNLSKRTGN